MSEDASAGAGAGKGIRESTIRAAVDAGRPSGRPTGIEPLGRGNRKLTRLVRFADREPVVVQLSRRRDVLTTEARLLGAVRARTAVPVPRPLADGTVDGVGYLVTEHRPGTDLHERVAALDPPVRRRLVASFGECLGELHGAFAFHGYGPVTGEDGRLRATADDWPGWLSAYGRRALGRLPGAFDDLRPSLRALFDEPAVDPAPPATLFPWDFRPGNALVDGGELSAVLDWEAPLAAPAPLAVAKAEYLVADWYADDPAPLREAFREGYERVRPSPDPDPVHRAVAVVATAVDSRGRVTTPGWPELDDERAVAFHRRSLERTLDGG
jgi:Ser/Thr protein kinase RdoA (MazF antagonist)